MYYLKMPTRYNLIDNGVDLPDENRLTLSFFKEEHTFEEVKSDFANISSVYVYGCIEQEDGRETDEFISNYFDKYTYLKSIEYNIDMDVYKVTLIIPNDTQARLTELEDAVNFMLMGE